MKKVIRFIKVFLKKIYSYKLYINVFCNSLIKKNSYPTKKPRLYYGGAPQGNFGGPLVKIKKLNYIFHENKWNFNVVYLLSSSLYLSFESIKHLK